MKKFETFFLLSLLVHREEGVVTKGQNETELEFCDTTTDLNYDNDGDENALCLPTSNETFHVAIYTVSSGLVGCFYQNEAYLTRSLGNEFKIDFNYCLIQHDSKYRCVSEGSGVNFYLSTVEGY